MCLLITMYQQLCNRLWQPGVHLHHCLCQTRRHRHCGLFASYLCTSRAAVFSRFTMAAVSTPRAAHRITVTLTAQVSPEVRGGVFVAHSHSRRLLIIQHQPILPVSVSTSRPDICSRYLLRTCPHGSFATLITPTRSNCIRVPQPGSQLCS